MADWTDLSPREIERLSSEVEREFCDAVAGDVPLTVVKAPPGSGKTHLLVRAVQAAASRGLRVAVGAQTNTQADDICVRLARDDAEASVFRFTARDAKPVDLGPRIHGIREPKHIPTDACVVVATVAKWSLTKPPESFNVFIVDEAWQMAWADFMLCSQVSPRFALIGDPGQIAPVVTIPVQRWETAPRAPHQPAPELILADPDLAALSLEMPVCRRLPYDSVDVVRNFYDFGFASFAQPGERSVTLGRRGDGGGSADEVLELLSERSTVALTLATPSDGPPLELDKEAASAAVDVALRALQRGAFVVDDASGEKRELRPEDIGFAATHRVMNTALTEALPANLRAMIQVDTPERWQGLERRVMIVIHPLSGVTTPSAFDIETGKLCVMVSRHRAGLVVVSRDHILHTLETHMPSAEQPVGRPDVTGRGHAANLRFWETLERDGLVVRAG